MIKNKNPDPLIKRLLKALEAKEKLLACYRLGKTPGEVLWKELDKVPQTVEAAERWLKRKVADG